MITYNSVQMTNFHDQRYLYNLERIIWKCEQLRKDREANSDEPPAAHDAEGIDLDDDDCFHRRQSNNDQEADQTNHLVNLQEGQDIFVIPAQRQKVAVEVKQDTQDIEQKQQHEVALDSQQQQHQLLLLPQHRPFGISVEQGAADTDLFEQYLEFKKVLAAKRAQQPSFSQPMQPIVHQTIQQPIVQQNFQQPIVQQNFQQPSTSGKQFVRLPDGEIIELVRIDHIN